MDTSVTDRRRQNVEDSSMLFKADNLHHQDSNAAINDWRKSRRVGEQGLACISFYHTHLSHQRIVSAPYLILSSLAMIPVVPLLGAVRGMPLSRIMLIGMKIHEDFEKSLQACKLLFSTRNFCSMFIVHPC